MSQGRYCRTCGVPLATDTKDSWCDQCALLAGFQTTRVTIIQQSLQAIEDGAAPEPATAALTLPSHAVNRPTGKRRSPWPDSATTSCSRSSAAAAWAWSTKHATRSSSGWSLSR